MRFVASRLRSGEIIAGAGSLALLICVFLLPWYGLSGRLEDRAAALGVATSLDGFNGLTILRWLMLATILTALLLVISQAACRAPAIPVTLSMLAMVLGCVTSLALIYRVLINSPYPDPPVSVKVGAYLGLVSALVLTYGAFRSLREEERPDPAANARIRTVSLGPR